MSEREIYLERAVSDHRTRLSSEYLPEAHQAQNEALRHQIEQSRLIIFGALGAMAVVATAMFATDRKLCLPFIELGYILLMLATAAGWYANAVLGACWDQTASLKFTNLQLLIAAAEGRDSTTEKLDFDAALAELAKGRNHGRKACVVGSSLGWFAFPAILMGVQETIAEKCSASVWLTFQRGVWDAFCSTWFF